MSRPMSDRQACARLPRIFTLRAAPVNWRIAHATLPPRVSSPVQQDSPLTIITNPKEARQPIPASDGADYLKTIPGFSAVRGGGSNSDPVLRGMFGSRLKLLTNGGEMLGACPSRM